MSAGVLCALLCTGSAGILLLEYCVQVPRVYCVLFALFGLHTYLQYISKNQNTVFMISVFIFAMFPRVYYVHGCIQVPRV